jgi:hypothetical protein
MDNTIKFFERECRNDVPQIETIILYSDVAIDDTSENLFQKC